MNDYLLLAVDEPITTRETAERLSFLARTRPFLHRERARVFQGFPVNQRVFFDGIGVFGDRLVRTSDEAAGATGKGRGNYLLARHSADGQVRIEIDPLGFYPLFLYHRDGVFCAGNNIFAMVQALQALGRDLRRDLIVHGWFTVQGTGAFNKAAYEDITLLPHGTVIHLDERNRVSYEKTASRKMFYASRPLGELIDDAAHEILGNVRGLARGDFKSRVCDLTGGMDSRLVVSALLHDGLEDAFHFHTKGSYPNPDANVAALIRRRFGLHKDSGFPSPQQTSLSQFEKLRLSLGQVNGLLSMFQPSRPGNPEDANHLSIGGGSGELLREFWSSGAGMTEVHPAWGWKAWFRRPVPTPTVSALDEKMRRMRDRSGFLKPEVRDGFLADVDAFASQAVAEGIRPKHVGDFFYLCSRAKYHFGVWWAASSRARFHPLYSPAAIKAAHAMNNADKVANRLGYELMRRFCPELTTLPFAEKSWNPSIMPDAPSPVTRKTAFLGDPDERTASETPRRKPAQGRSELQRRLLSAGHKRRVVELGTMLEEFHSAERDYSALERVFDVDAVRAFLAKPQDAFTGRYDAYNAYRLMGAYAWANELEIRGRCHEKS